MVLGCLGQGSVIKEAVLPVRQGYGIVGNEIDENLDFYSSSPYYARKRL